MRRGFLKRPLQSEESSLQITSMADIFTILLVFLLKSYTTGAINVTPSKGVLLPQAQAAEANFEALKVEISPDAVQIEGQPVANLNRYQFDARDLSQGASQTVSKAFEKERKRQLTIAAANSDVKIDPRIIVLADEHVPYNTLKSVLAAAALQGYTDFKLAVVRGD